MRPDATASDPIVLYRIVLQGFVPIACSTMLGAFATGRRPSTSGVCPMDQDITVMADIVVEEAHQGQTIRARIGDRIVVRLEENPTTGFLWSVLGDLEGCSASESHYRPFSSESIGGGGIRELAFTVDRAGSLPLHLAMRQPWESEATPARRFSVTVLADGDKS